MLNAIAKVVPWLIGGSADLAPSTKTRLTFDGAGDFGPESLTPHTGGVDSRPPLIMRLANSVWLASASTACRSRASCFDTGAMKSVDRVDSRMFSSAAALRSIS